MTASAREAVILPRPATHPMSTFLWPGGGRQEAIGGLGTSKALPFSGGQVLPLAEVEVSLTWARMLCGSRSAESLPDVSCGTRVVHTHVHMCYVCILCIIEEVSYG